MQLGQLAPQVMQTSLWQDLNRNYPFIKGKVDLCLRYIDDTFFIWKGTKRGYDKSSIETEIKKIKLLDRKNLLTPKITQKNQVLPLTMTYNCSLPNIKQIIRNHWSILKANKDLQKTFPVEPIIAFHKNKSLKQLIGGNTIQNNRNIKKSTNKYEGKCTPCISGMW